MSPLRNPIATLVFLTLSAPPLLLAQDTAVRRAKPATTPRTGSGAFVVDPYLQLGDAPTITSTATMQVLWQAKDDDDDNKAGWSVDYRPEGATTWRHSDRPSMRRIAVGQVEPHRIYKATLTGLRPGGRFEYRVNRDDRPVFSSNAQARKGPDQPIRFVAFGDCGANTSGQRAVAYQTHLARPDFVFIAGDIVYSRGQDSEYREKFWPIYNAAEAAPAVGAPLLRSTLFVAAPGNHDIATGDLKTYPDGLAYFYNWSQPMNGPGLAAGDANTTRLEGPEANRRAFLEAAGDAFPRMANFSFDNGNTHWVVLDSNPYADWTTTELRSWVERDLTAAKQATWRIVAFHHPGFNSSRKHFSEQRMRRMAETFESGEVDLVISGHVHNYQRTYPLKFVPESSKAAKKKSGEVGGRWSLDRSFDGAARSRPDGVIYLVTGGGGANLYDPEQQDDPGTWQEFTHKFLAKMHSLTIVDADGPTLKVRQVSSTGEEVDRFTMTK
jgi:hypothetical protein